MQNNSLRLLLIFLFLLPACASQPKVDKTPPIIAIPSPEEPGRPEAYGVRDIGAYEFIDAPESNPVSAIPAILLLLLSDELLAEPEGYEPPEAGEFDGWVNSYFGTFAEAFAAARKVGDRIFKWNGKIFHTRLTEEVGEQKPPEPGTFEEAFGNARKAGKGAGDTFEWNGKLYDAGIVGENVSEIQPAKDKLESQ